MRHFEAAVVVCLWSRRGEGDFSCLVGYVAGTGTCRTKFCCFRQLPGYGLAEHCSAREKDESACERFADILCARLHVPRGSGAVLHDLELALLPRRSVF